jgi:peptidoglycan/xylan/chitin deacetylase (PgdA/CDA1 family)
VRRYPHVIRRLQAAGAEIAVHSYNHVDLSVYPPTEAREQLQRAVQAFEFRSIEVYGFRCPYLSCTDDLMDALPADMFDYSSNEAIWWDVVSPAEVREATAVLDTLQRFYNPGSAEDAVCTPWMRSGLVEIPVSLPDDLQLHDGLHLGPEGMSRAWGRILHRTHRRGELFVLQFHPELAGRCEPAFAALFRDIAKLQPAVWIARLRDVSTWWNEKSNFGVATSRTPDGLHISFKCSERATILIRDLPLCGPEDGLEDTWDGRYCQLKTRSLCVPAEPRPFVGLSADVHPRIVTFLQEQGYILDTGETAARCATYIDGATLAGLTSELKIIEYIETSPGPLVRYWRWPQGAKSALCVTGDLDALTLLDYVHRLFVT